MLTVACLVVLIIGSGSAAAFYFSKEESKKEDEKEYVANDTNTRVIVCDLLFFAKEIGINDADIFSRISSFEEKFISIRENFALLDIEDKHQVEHTIVRDLKELLVVYMELSEKNRIIFKPQLFLSFDTVDVKLTKMQENLKIR